MVHELEDPIIAVKFSEVDAFVPYGPLYPETSWVVEPGSGTFVRVHCSVALDVITLGMFGRVVLVTHGFPKRQNQINVVQVYLYSDRYRYPGTGM